MTTAVRTPPSDLIYPETDGEPMAENTIQYRYLTMVKGGLEVVFKDRSDVFVAGDLFWYPVEGAPEIRAAPDVLVAVGRPKGDRGSYMQWREGGVPPHVVFEIVSPGNRHAAMIEKFRFYERHGVLEYYIYDPDSGELSGWQRAQDALEPLDRMQGWVSPLLGVRFEVEGTDLRLFGTDGRSFATYEELAEQRDRAEAERDRERQRAERLAARLRELGVTPDE
jgi:Uma2 family endonuclease